MCDAPDTLLKNLQQLHDRLGLEQLITSNDANIGLVGKRSCR